MASLAPGCKKTNEDVIRESIVARFEPYKNADQGVIDRLSKTAEDEGLPEMGVSGQDFAYAILDGFDYSIGKIEISGNHATGQVKISSKSAQSLDEELKDTEKELEFLSNQALDPDYKTDKIKETIMQAVKDTEVIEEEIMLDFSLDGTEWTSNNATEKLGKLDSIVFSS